MKRVRDLKYSLLRTKKFCQLCYKQHTIEKENSRGRSSSLIDIGAPENSHMIMSIKRDRESYLGFTGVPPDWEIFLLQNGISQTDQQAHPAEAWGSAAFFKQCAKPLPSQEQVTELITPQLLHHRNPNDVYQILKKLGEGGYGAVFKAIRISDKSKFALKSIQCRSKTKYKNILNEIGMMQLSEHPNIISYHESYEYMGNIFIVMELMQYNVTQLIHAQRGIPELHMAYILFQVLLGLAFLHDEHRMHRDIKSDNILLDSNGNVKLGDFGYSAQLTQDMKYRQTIAGTTSWMAPELVQGRPYSCKADIWSLGILAIELADGDAPYIYESPVKQMFLIATNPPPKPHYPPKWSSEFNCFVKACLDKDPASRPYAKELLGHSFFSKVNNLTQRDFALYLQKIRSLK